MAQSTKCLVWVCVIFSWFLCSCTTDTLPGHEILHIEGVSAAFNVTTTYVHFGAAYEYEQQWEVRLPVSDGDLLYMWDENDMQLYYRYNSEDGNHLVVSRDTLKPHMVFVNGVLSQVELRDEESCQTLAGELSVLPAQMHAPLLICDTVTDGMVVELEKSQALLDGSGLAIETGISSGLFNKITAICRPEWMVLHTLPFDQDAGQTPVLETPELLWIEGDLPEFSSTIQQCRNLESLIISDWEPEEGELISLLNLKKLHTLTLAECGIQDLSHIEFPSNLQRLHMVGCDTLTDISGISAIPHLKSFGLAGSFDVASLQPITGLEQLNRVSFPGNTSQADFESIVGRAQSLEVVELLLCLDVVDLSPLKDQENLKILILHTDSILPEKVGSLSQLKLILLTKEVFDDSPELISELRTQLPATQIVPGSGLCLGSGWLLLILPLVIVSRLLFRKK